MTDLTKLKEMAERATPGPWTLYVPENYQGPEELPGYGVECAEGRAIIWGALEPETGCQFDRDAEFIASANPQTILGLLERLEKAEQHWANENSNNMALIAEVERLHRVAESAWSKADEFGNKMFWMNWDQAKRGGFDHVLEERDRLKAENEALRSALQAVHAEVDGNIRPLTRDLVNMVSGVKNGSHPNDIYDHCDEIDRIIDAAMEGGAK